MNRIAHRVVGKSVWRNRRWRLASLAACAAAALGAGAPATRPTTQPTGRAQLAADDQSPATRPSTFAPDGRTPDQILEGMLAHQPPAAPDGQPLANPDKAPGVDSTSGAGAVKPNAPAVTLLREGSAIDERVGRLTHAADGSQAQFTFDSDGAAMKDPPLIILPNLKLMAMEDAEKSSNRDLHFRISGFVTEYRGRNYILLEKVVVVPDATRQFDGK